MKRTYTYKEKVRLFLTVLIPILVTQLYPNAKKYKEVIQPN
ncbi:hypothetical protein [Alkalihalobacterium bogoriense]|nr:hypothetical protein [Alkalihalobacterium bogoriense]